MGGSRHHGGGNTVRIGETVALLRAAGEAVSDEDFARISPVAYAHVIPNGTYVFNRSHTRAASRSLRYCRFSQTGGSGPKNGQFSNGERP